MWYVEDSGLSGRILIPFESYNEALAYSAQRFPDYCPVIFKECA